MKALKNVGGTELYIFSCGEFHEDEKNTNDLIRSCSRLRLIDLRLIDLRLTILRKNKLDVVGFIRRERFYSEEHINASGLHVVRAAYFPSAMAARAREGKTEGEREGGLKGWRRIATGR